VRFAQNVGVGYGSYWRGVIFDRKYKNLDDLIIKSKRIFRAIFGDRCKFLESKGDYKWVWDTGEELMFRQFLKPTITGTITVKSSRSSVGTNFVSIRLPIRTIA
jgi:hypothetical protein